MEIATAFVDTNSLTAASAGSAFDVVLRPSRLFSCEERDDEAIEIDRGNDSVS